MAPRSIRMWCKLAPRLSLLLTVLLGGATCACVPWDVDPAVSAASLVGWSLLGYLVAEQE